MSTTAYVDEAGSLPDPQSRYIVVAALVTTMDRFHVPSTPIHLDSQSDAIIQLADFVAGAILYQMTGKGNFARIVEEKVAVGKMVKWTHLGKKINGRNAGRYFTHIG